MLHKTLLGFCIMLIVVVILMLGVDLVSAQAIDIDDGGGLGVGAFHPCPPVDMCLNNTSDSTTSTSTIDVPPTVGPDQPTTPDQPNKNQEKVKDHGSGKNKEKVQDNNGGGNGPEGLCLKTHGKQPCKDE